MKPSEIKEILQLISELDLKEVRIKNEDFEIRVRTAKDEVISVASGAMTTMAPAPVPMAMPAPAVAAAPASPTGESDSTVESDNSSDYIEVRSPMVGTFYRAASPDKPPFVQVGDSISSGQVVCIIEAMKLFNEIESEVSGKIVKVMVDDSSPVEYDQVLFLVDPNG
ncbi:MAG: acetyl-CoA carboxylase biotin carboxyl carrier protein [Bacteroidota bacterium]